MVYEVFSPPLLFTGHGHEFWYYIYGWVDNVSHVALVIRA